MDKDPLFDKVRSNAQFRKVRAAGIACREELIPARRASPVAPMVALRVD
jgi:hypothetical protein